MSQLQASMTVMSGITWTVMGPGSVGRPAFLSVPPSSPSRPFPKTPRPPQDLEGLEGCLSGEGVWPTLWLGSQVH